MDFLTAANGSLTGSRLPARLAFNARAALITALLVALAAGLCLLGPRIATTSRSVRASRAAASRSALSSLPLAAQGVVSASLGSADPAYRVRTGGRALVARNRAQGLDATFDSAAVVVAAGGLRAGLHVRGLGYGSSLRALAPARPRARANRVVYSHADLDEWYADGPLGLEQGFTVPRAPPGGARAPLTIAMALSGNGRTALTGGGRTLQVSRGGARLRMTGLLAADARGRQLHAWLSLEHTQLLVRIDARGARYPVRIDPLIQQGKKLVGGEEYAERELGRGVALSADGSTAIVGGPSEVEGEGAAWVFTRSGATWSQQGQKLTAGAEVTCGFVFCGAQFGASVALSADGNTALIGSPGDNSASGAAWVFTRSGTTWTQQGGKLTGGGEVSCGSSFCGARFGDSVALSADGDTALIGAEGDDESVGAAWAFTRSGSVWTQQGEKLTGGGEVAGCCGGAFGHSVALSADGDTALIGGEGDNSRKGAAWVFTRSGSEWAQQGEKLTGARASAFALVGSSVALSADGDTALIGGEGDSEAVGAAWVFVRAEGVWAHQGGKLTASDEGGAGSFGADVSLSANGNTALIGGSRDAEESGAAWTFARTGSKWKQQGGKLTGGGQSGRARFGAAVALSAEGETALIGGPRDNGLVGAAWAFTRSGSVWTQQGEKLTVRGVTAHGQFGESVAVSGDGDTILVGGNQNEHAAAAWVFTRSGQRWKQQAKLLLGEDNGGAAVALSADGDTALIGRRFAGFGEAFVFTRAGSSWSLQEVLFNPDGRTAGFGASVALSGDGNTALITAAGKREGPPDPEPGDAWVYVREGTTWTRQGAGLEGAQAGAAVALSGDGSTALAQNPASGALAFVRSGSTWTRQGGELDPSDAAGEPDRERSVALSFSGDRAIIGGPDDNGATGGAWVFTRSESSWSQDGPKLTGAGESGAGEFGSSVAISADGTAVLIGGRRDQGSTGAAWLFERTAAGWSQDGEKLTGRGEARGCSGEGGGFGTSVALSADARAAVIGAPFDHGCIGAAWAFAAPRPAVTTVTPSFGPTGGGTVVTVSGSGFATGAGATSIRFGASPAAGVSCESHTTCTAIAPPHKTGSVDVTATVDGVTSLKSTADLYSYS